MKKNLYAILILVFIFNIEVSAQIKEKPILNKQEKEIQKGEKEKENESRIEKREERRITNCSEISSKVINRKTQLEKTVNNYSNSINRVETVIKARIDALKKDGKDTSEIEGNLAKYKSESQVLLNLLHKK